MLGRRGGTVLSRSRRFELMASTSWAMTASTFQLFIIAVLAANLIEELGLARWQIGVLGAVNTGVGAVTAPRLGRVADRLGAPRAIVILVAWSAVGIMMTAAAVNFWLLVAASAVSGLPQGACNPVTNKLIAERVPRPQQGLVTGVKQSGVQVAVFLAGAILPTSANTFGWRWAVVIAGLFTLATAVILAVRFLPGSAAAARKQAEDNAGPAPKTVTSGFVNQVAVYAFLLGMCAGGVTRFYPLFAHEVLGYSEAVAGLSVSVAGLSAIVARLVWARLIESTIAMRPALIVLGLGSSVTVSLLYIAESGASWLLWPAVVGIAFSVAAWNVVAMLAVIRTVAPEQSGRATGVVLLGFLGGLTIAAPVVGWSVDQFGSYRPAWVVLAILALFGSAAVSREDLGRLGKRRRPALAPRQSS